MTTVDESMSDTRPNVLLAATAQPMAASRTVAARLAAKVLRDRELHRVVSFLFAGGISAIVTLTVTSVLESSAHLPFLIAAICGTELGILVNFTVNDVVSFRDLAGHRRGLPARVARFHLTCAVGQSLILLLSLLLHDLWHWPTVFAQAVPIVLVTAVNFTMHRFWTYRGRQR